MSEARIEAFANVAGITGWRGRKGKQRPADILQTVKLMYWCYLMSVEHSLAAGSIPIHSGEFKALSPAHRKYVKRELFDCTFNGWSEKDGITKGYRLKPAIKQGLRNMDYQPNRKSKVIDLTTGKTATIKRQLKTGNPIAGLPELVELNMPSISTGLEAVVAWLNHFQNNGPKPEVLRGEIEATIKARKRKGVNCIKGICQYLEQAQSELLALLDTAGNQNGCIVQHYAQADSGRQYTVGGELKNGVSLQNCTTLARSIAMNGNHSFDFQTCHHSIALQVAQNAGLKLDYLARYVSHKKQVRDELAAHTGQPVKAIKQVLCAEMFGATKTNWFKGAYMQALGSDGYKRLWANDYFNGLHDDLQTFFSHALDSAKRDKQGNAINCLGLPAPTGADPKQQVAHLMQGYEAKCARAAIDATNGTVLWLHDGWISTRLQDTTATQKAVFAGTGFRLQIEHERIELSGLPVAQIKG